MSQLDELRAFLAVARAGSFAAAASQLEHSPSYASKLVSRLEARLEVRLFDRTTRTVTLTSTGERFFEDCSEALERLDAAQDAVRAEHREISGRLRVTLPTGLGHEWLTCTLAHFARDNPELHLEVVYLDRVVDLVSEGFDAAIRVGTMPDSSLIVRRVATTRLSLVASPALLERHGAPADPEALLELPCLVYAQEDRPAATWVLEREGEVRRLTLRGRMVVNSGRALVDAAACDLGIAFVPEIHSARLLATGELVRILPEWGSEVPIQVVHPSARLVPARVRAFVDYIGEHLREPGWLRRAPNEELTKAP